MLNEVKLFKVQQESPLVELIQLLTPLTSGASTAFTLTEKPFLELVNIKGEADSVPFLDAVKSVTGAAVPTVPNTVSEGAGFSIYWLAPNEWLIQSTAPRMPVLEASLRKLLVGQFASVVDVTSGSTTLILSGDKVREVLQKGCPLDLHPRIFTVGKCAQSHYFKAGILLRPLANGSYEMVIRRSFADYLGRILLDATEEFTG